MALNVYKASAGTGKTYQLTLAYLTLLLGDPTHFDPYAFYRVLAVTFTNKATNQMKTRILDTLALLSRGEISSITEDLCRETGLSHDQLFARAKIVHRALLHNYSRFSVSTLDAFFQRILQSFVLEAGLSQGYSIDTDTDYLIDKTARRMVAGISKDTSLRQWFIELIHEKWSRSDRWDTLRLLKQTGQQATRESFRIMGEDFAQHIGDRSFLKQALQTYQNLIYGFENQMAGLGKKALRLLEERGFSVADFPYKNLSFAAYFQKITALYPAVEAFIPGKRVWAATEGEETLWYNKKSPEGLENLQEILKPVLEEILEYFNNHYRAYATAVAVKEQIPQMGLLADVITTMRQIQEESNTLDLGDSTYLLSRLVGEGNVPFVYERVGTRYDSFLLDEFQDTSALQWMNMYPLVLNGLSQGYDSLMVGDVKQSIYRWRNSDWRILGEKIALDPVLKKQGVDFFRLHTNYRSSPQVVQFVNRLIGGVSRSLTRELENKLDENSLLEQKEKEYLGQLIKRAYEGYECITPPERECSPPDEECVQEGYVQVNTLYATHKDSAEQKVLQHVQDLLLSLLSRGYCPSDILILVRTNAEARTLLSYFLKQKQEGKHDGSDSLQVLTEEALYLAASPYVNLTVALLTLSLFPADTCTAEAVSYMAGEMGNKDIAKDTGFLQKLKLLPLPDAFEAILQKMKWSDKAEAFPYLQEFHDTILDFSGKHSGGTYAFLVWWHERGKEKLLSVDTSHQAIRMLTIHKAKGLEAPVVIVPFCNWALDPSGTDNQIVWASTEQIPFNKPEWLPVRYSNKLKHTYFAKDYYLEYSQRLLDALNLLYVATTRPKQELYVFLPFSKDPSLTNISGHVKEIFFPEEGMPDDREWSVGTKSPVQPVAQEDGKAPVQVYKLQTYGSGSFSTSLVLAREEDNFNYAPDDSRRQWGIVLHKALSRIHSHKDIPVALEGLVTEGELSGHLEHVKHMAQVLEKTLSAPGVSDWFDGSWFVRTEPTIAGPGGNLRPDRVMEKEGKAVVLDYKFGRPDPAHQKQMDLYVAALKRMGYSQVEGHLLYMTL